MLNPLNMQLSKKSNRVIASIAEYLFEMCANCLCVCVPVWMANKFFHVRYFSIFFVLFEHFVGVYECEFVRFVSNICANSILFESIDSNQ